MAVMVPRYLEKMVSRDGNTTYTFPLAKYQWTRSQKLNSLTIPTAGSHYPFDALGTARSIKDAKLFTVKGLVISRTTGSVVDTEMDSMDINLQKIGGGKIYVLDQAGARRWCYGRMARSAPSLTWGQGNLNFTTFEVSLEGYSDWFDSTQFDTTYTIDASPKTITVNNTGNERVYNAIFTLKGPATGPTTIVNNTSVYTLSSSRTLAGGQWEKFDAGQGSVQYSSTGGASYVADFSTFSFVAGQIQLMVLEPGNNTVVVTGANGSTLQVTFYPAYA